MKKAEQARAGEETALAAREMHSLAHRLLAVSLKLKNKPSPRRVTVGRKLKIRFM